MGSGIICINWLGSESESARHSESLRVPCPGRWLLLQRRRQVTITVASTAAAPFKVEPPSCTKSKAESWPLNLELG